MKNHKLELIFAGIFLVIYLVMIGIYPHVETNSIYDEIAGLLLIGCVVLGSKVAWEKFIKRLSDDSSGGYTPIDKLDTTNPPKK